MMGRDAVSWWLKVTQVAELLSRLVVGGLFIYAGLFKIMAPAIFAKTIFGYGLLPGEMVNGVAIMLPWIEIVSGAFLIAGVWPEAASGVIASLLLAFMLAIIFNIGRGYEFDCGCFGAGDDETGWGTVIRDLLMFVPCMGVLVYRGGRLGCVLGGDSLWEGRRGGGL